MIINGHFLPSEPLENFLSASYDRRRKYFEPERHTRIQRRTRLARTRYFAGCHADWVWTRYIGRVWIAKTRKAA